MQANKQKALEDKELNRTVDDLISLAGIYDKSPNEKPGQFLSKVMNRFPLIKKLKEKHFRRRIK